MSDQYDEQADQIVGNFMHRGLVEHHEHKTLKMAGTIARALRAAADGARREAVESCRRQIKATADSYPRAKRMLDPNDPEDRAQMTPLFQVAYILDREHERMGTLLQPDPVAAAREVCRHTNLTRPEPEWECLRCGERFGRGTCAEAAERAAIDKGEG